MTTPTPGTTTPGSTTPGTTPGPVAFVLGGGGVLGAVQVGMLQALLEAGVSPDLVLGTSVGALNGAFVAADPTPAAAGVLSELWSEAAAQVFASSLPVRVATAVRSRTHVHPMGPLKRLAEQYLPARDFADLAVPFQCVAASVERSAAHWFASGPLVPAVLASCAVPGLLPAVRVGEEHYLDGGLVDSVPVGRAVALGARTVFVLQVGRMEAPLRPARWPWEVGLVAFEVVRRHSYSDAMLNLPQDVDVHVLPTGDDPIGTLDRRSRRPPGTKRGPDRVALAYRASTSYLERNDLGVGARPSSA